MDLKFILTLYYNCTTYIHLLKTNFWDLYHQYQYYDSVKRYNHFNLYLSSKIS